MRLWGLAALAAGAALLAGVGCGGNEEEHGAGGDGDPLVVFAASSLEPAFEAYAESFDAAAVEFSFAGSDALAAQIRQGSAPDVFAAANTAYPEELFGEGLLKRPEVFATNRLVLAVPAASSIESVAAVAEPGVSVAIGAEGVPVGDYTREVLGELPTGQGEAILANVGSEEPDVAGIVGKLTQGAVDAGFVYVSDVATAGGAVRAIELPKAVAPDIAYGAGVGAKAADATLAEEFIGGLLSGPGAEALAANEFGPPPR